MIERARVELANLNLPGRDPARIYAKGELGFVNLDGSDGDGKEVHQIAAGATVVIKPAPETPLDAIILAQAVEQAGIPKGVVNVVAASAYNASLPARAWEYWQEARLRSASSNRPAPSRGTLT